MQKGPICYGARESDERQCAIRSNDDQRELVRLNAATVRDWDEWDDVVLDYLIGAKSMPDLYDKLSRVSCRDFLVIDEKLNAGQV